MKKVATMYAPHAYEKELTPLRQAGFTIDWLSSVDENVTEEELIEQLKGYSYVIAAGERYTAKVLEALAQSGLKMIARMGVGYDHIDIRSAKRCGVHVANTPGANANAVAEHALMLTLAAARGLIQSRRTIESGVWVERPWPLDLKGATVALLGFGGIARIYAELIAPIAGRVIAYDPEPNVLEAQRLGVEIVSFQELIEKADVLSLHLPLNEHTRNLIGRVEFERMKPNLVFVNTSRGGIVDEQALYDALISGRIHAAGLDVYEQEPISPDNRLLTLSNLIATPHNASFTRDAFSRMMAASVENLIAHIRGEHIPFEVC